MEVLIVLCAFIAAGAGDVSHLPTNDYLPPSHHHAASAPAASYSAEPSYNFEAASAPAVSYSAPASQSYHIEAASAPAVSYSAPAAQSYESASYEGAASEPAHTFSASEGYRYKTAKRRVIRRQRRDVSHLSSEYLPPAAASTNDVQYESAPSYYGAASEPAVSYETASYESAASEPAHSYSSADGYHYKTAKRRVIRRQRRDVSHLPTNDYLPPHQGAASAPSAEYLPAAAASVPVAQYESAPSYSVAASAPALSYSGPAASYETASYETAASEPAHSYSSAEGYRYKTAKRRVIRRRRF